MFSNMLGRQVIISTLYTATFLAAFHLVARNPFEMFVVFGLFTIFLKLQLTNDIAELRAQGYLSMRMMNSIIPENEKLRENMEAIFDADDLLLQFSDNNKDAVSGDYNGRMFGRIISLIGQIWMLGFIFWYI